MKLPEQKFLKMGSENGYCAKKCTIYVDNLNKIG